MIIIVMIIIIIIIITKLPLHLIVLLGCYTDLCNGYIFVTFTMAGKMEKGKKLQTIVGKIRRKKKLLDREKKGREETCRQ